MGIIAFFLQIWDTGAMKRRLLIAIFFIAITAAVVGIFLFRSVGFQQASVGELLFPSVQNSELNSGVSAQSGSVMDPF